jgi:hypothetical protein
MKTFKLLKVIVIAFAVIIVVLLGVLTFVKPVQGPAFSVSPDGHVMVTTPLPNTLIASPVTVSGSVVNGQWFFEASFPVKVLDGDGTVIGQGQAQAQSDWTATGTVPFSANISFTAPHYATGTIVFSKDNPSGMPGNAEEFSVPVMFK